MFSSNDPHKPVYFGLWAEEPEDKRKISDALAVLRHAAGACADRDMRSDELKAALAFLEKRMVRPALCGHYRSSLDLKDPLARAAAVRAACEAIERAV